jgi:hypothetical protein
MNPAGERYVQFDSPRQRAGLNTAPPVPAFSWIKHNWRLAGIRIGDHDIRLADLDALVAAVADFRIKSQRLEWRCLRRYEDSPFMLHLFFSLR